MKQITETKHKCLPKVVMSSDFEKEWNNYVTEYNQCNPQDFLNEMQAEVNKRIEAAK